ncbi:hypothetical protein Tco_1309341 [Tanacetum coccineum]
MSTLMPFAGAAKGCLFFARARGDIVSRGFGLQGCKKTAAKYFAIPGSRSVGLPADKAHYIHRVGRTRCKGKQGQGLLLLTSWEQFFLYTLKDLPISKTELRLVDPDTKKKVEKASSNMEMKNKESAYQALFGYYNSNKTS